MTARVTPIARMLSIGDRLRGPGRADDRARPLGSNTQIRTQLSFYRVRPDILLRSSSIRARLVLVDLLHAWFHATSARFPPSQMWRLINKKARL